MKKALLFTVVCVILSVSGGCVRHYGLPELYRAKKPEPQEDFGRLSDLFHEHEGQASSPGDSEVVWKDTPMFRVFKLKNHSVAVFPYNWRRTGFNVILFAGHLKPGINPFDAVTIQYREDSPGVQTHSVDGIEMSIDQLPRDVSFHGFRLGADRDDVIQDQINFIRDPKRTTIKGTTTRDQEVGLLNAASDMAICYRDDIEFRLIFKDKKLVYITGSPMRFPSLDEWTIRHPQTPIELDGRFPLAR